MLDHYEKVAYVWDLPERQVAVPDRLVFRRYTAFDPETLIGLVADVMGSSLNRSDRESVARLEADRAARDFIAEAGGSFVFEPR